ncbi:toll/interleukin-1 receptor domain-containing protein [Dactylosporangium salmoneum]|uniref:TIR domain-containing protein n=1 Tax=Dactylosporangium salmoneum TaxID=53361 RepID=A0ABN3HUN3_9ACTN
MSGGLSDEELAAIEARARDVGAVAGHRQAWRVHRLDEAGFVVQRDSQEVLVRAGTSFGQDLAEYVAQAALDLPRLVAEVGRLRKLAGYDKGLVWDADDRIIDQDWSGLRRRIEETHGGVGIVAADFDELLRYGYGQPGHRRKAFTRLVAGATEDDDIELLAEILAVMLIDPWRANLQGGWFIHRLRTGDGLEAFDAGRAARVLNRLYDVNDATASVLVETLRAFVTNEGGPKRRLLELIRESGQLRREVAMLIEPARVFVSYCREDEADAERIYQALGLQGFRVWKDTHDLLPGENWESKIRRTLSEYEFAVICLSRTAVAKRGFFQVELKVAARMQQERAEDDVYIIPVRVDPELDARALPSALAGLHVADLAADWDDGLEQVVRTIVTHRRVV